MRSEFEIKAMKIKGFMYYACKSGDFFLSLDNLQNKVHDLNKSNLDICLFEDILVIFDRNDFRFDKVKKKLICNSIIYSIPIIYNLKSHALMNDKDCYRVYNNITTESDFETIDLTNFYFNPDIRISNYRIFYKMFKSIKIGKSLDVYTCLNTAFEFCSCKIIDFTDFTGKNVLSAKYMFAYCHNLNFITWNYLNFRKLQDAAFMFCGCENLKNLNVAAFPVSASYKNAFNGTRSLPSVFSEAMLSTGQIQEHCMLNAKLIEFQKSSTIWLHIISKEFVDGYINVLPKNWDCFVLEKNRVIGYSLNGVSLDDLYELWQNISSSDFERFLSVCHPNILDETSLNFQDIPESFRFSVLLFY